MGLFPKMVEIVPPGESGDAKIVHFEVSETDSRFTALRGGRDYVPAGRYAKLIVGRALMMSDTRHEQITNYEVVQRAKGHVFIGGLGLGMVTHAIAAKPEVTKITVLEKSQGVIDLVGHTLPSKVEVIQGDVFDYKPGKSQKFACIYFDIWPDLNTDNLSEMTKLHRRFRKYLTDDGWMDSWCRGILRSERRRDQRNKNSYGFWR
jgi:hypothetical protein